MATSSSRLVGITSRLAVFAGSAFGLAAVQHADAAATFADFDAATSSSGTSGGTIDGVGFTMTVTNGVWDNPNPNGDFTGNAYDNSGTHEYAEYDTGSSVTITFNTPVDNLQLYLRYFRNAVSGMPTGAVRYVFNEDFSLNANFEGGTLTSAPPDNVVYWTGNNSDLWMNGILTFSGPISSLTWTAQDGNPGAGWNDVTTAAQGFTFSGTASASAVPGAGLAGLATIGLAGASRRRRR